LEDLNKGAGVYFVESKRDLLASMPPVLGGGMMIQEVHRDRFTPAELPAKFEAGTPPIADAVGLAAAIEWLTQFSWSDIEAHEQSLLSAAVTALSAVPHLTILGGMTHASSLRSGCVSFVVDGVHPHDLTDMLGQEGICLRAGHHCTQPLHRHLGIPASTRLSVGIYNTAEEIAITVEALSKAAERLQRSVA
jgi:cysteine desulfurase/selenocysteine lyase